MQFGVLKGVIFQGYSTHSLVNLRVLIQTLSCLLEGHVLVLWLSFMVSLFLIFVILMEGMKPPLYRWWGFLFWRIGAFCIREVDRCCHSSWHRVTYPFHYPSILCLALPTMTQFCDWLHSLWGSLSASINGHWCNSLCLTYLFLLRSAATLHYLRSSPILSGHSSRHPWQKSQLPIFPPQGDFTGRSLGDCLTTFFLWHPLPFTSYRGSLAWGGAGTPVLCMTAAHTQGNANLWCNKKKSVSVEYPWPSVLVHQFIGGVVCCDLMHHLPSLFFPPILYLPLSLPGSAFTSTRLPGFKFTTPIFLS